jgi:serine/threonine protein kinase
MLECDAAGALVVKVIDYGVAKVLAPEAERGAEQTQTGFIGTPAFASPEQFPSIGQPRIDTRSDIYSLGVTFWYLRCLRSTLCGTSRCLRATFGWREDRRARACPRRNPTTPVQFYSHPVLEVAGQGNPDR